MSHCVSSTLSFQLANKLGSAVMPAMVLREVIETALTAQPEILDAVAADICAVKDRDPAVRFYSTPLLYLKGFHALQGYRVSHWLWNQGRRALATFCKIRFQWSSVSMFTRRRVSDVASCLTMHRVSSSAGPR